LTARGGATPHNRRMSATVTLLLLMTAAAQAQTGQLHGRVLDPSQAVIVGATVVITDLTGTARSVKTDRQGAFRVDRIPAGPVAIHVTAAGFADFDETVTLRAGSDVTVDATLTIAVQRQTVDVSAQAQPGIALAANANALILKGADLDAFSDDPNELEAQLHALAAGAPGGGRIYVDGFTAGKLPPKAAIQEIRVNQDPYSAEFDTPGSGRVDIVTRPASAMLRGRFLLDATNPSFNSRNPFLSRKPSYGGRAFTGMLDGPLGPKASFSVLTDVIRITDASSINAIALDSAFRPARLQQVVRGGQHVTEVTPRIDTRPFPNNTLSVRYQLYEETDPGSGVGQLALASQAFDARKAEHDVQLSDLHVISARAVNDLRLEYRRDDVTHTVADASPQLTVIGAFTSGGSSMGNLHTVQTHMEVHDVFTSSRGAHVTRIGGLVRTTAATDRNPQNFNGTFTFASLDAYRITQQGLEQGWSPASIRANGGGASQFSISVGDATVSQTMVDAAVFAQDEWRLGGRSTVGLGVRYETQNGIEARGGIAPRASLAVSLGKPRSGASPAWVIRTGAGLFYDRVPQSVILQALRLDGAHTRQYIIASPDFFPALPSIDGLASAQIPATVYRLGSNLQPPKLFQTGATLEHRFGKASTVAAGYVYTHGADRLLSRNVNAPRGAIPEVPLYEVESAGRLNQHQFTANVNFHLRSWLTANGVYALSSARGDSESATSFPSNPFDLAADYGRTSFDVRHRLTMFFGINGPGFRIVPSLYASSGQPFDITLGQDLNADSIFNDRPAFATDLTRPSVVLTRWGAFDSSPVAGQRIIPRNLGTGPAQVVVNLRAMKPFVVHGHGTIRIDLVAGNLFNRVNLALPVGNLNSPTFGRSTALAGGGPSSANRQLRAQLQFIF
jgi:carboxypeptidase family protein